ncbi:flagellar protein FlgN [Pseudoalteromonas shioyasakiensis]|uniref:flagellar export chaperone FlgN n=1 Tax=Pseudoalteromonas shioyasakiensis TaxID=1190813 RepID=UPI002117A011|nr:flagellar export chaperone FlgN [Pseudoalteromonas shioyasakiensis]MCQ8877522.1 flagellar protein FlgN [Pseudoalteromonas shioyasakiensis]
MTINSIKLYITSLRQDIKKLDVLISALESQYELLNKRDTGLDKHNIKMLEVLNSLEQTHAQRDAFLISLSLPSGSKGLRLLCNKLPEPVKSMTTDLLQELTIKSKHCKALNERSGKLLASQRQLMQRLTGVKNNNSYPEMNI